MKLEFYKAIAVVQEEIKRSERAAKKTKGKKHYDNKVKRSKTL